MSRWAPIPPRQPGEALASIHFSSDKTGEGKNRYFAHFRHRDGRVWQAVITGIDTIVDDVTYQFVIEVSSGGCRVWRFLARTFAQAKRVVDRFSNMEISRYQRLVVDAQGTTEFPVAGQVGVFKMRFRGQQTTPSRRAEAPITEISGVARYNGEEIIVFPRTQELTEIISDVCRKGTVVIIPQQINEIQDPAQGQRLLVSHGAAAQRGVFTTDVAEDDLLDALDRLRNDTTEHVLASVQTGSYRFAGRQERAFDLGEEED